VVKPTPDANPKTHRAILAMLSSLSPGAAVLDAPCGSGALTWELLRRGYQATPGDACPRRYQVPAPPCHAVDLNQALPFPDNTFHAAVCCEGPQVLENPAQAVREFARVLKPGGILVVALPNVANLFSRGRFLLTGFYNKFIRPYDEANGEGNCHPMTFPELRYVLHRNGFRVEKVGTNRYKPSHLLPLPVAPLVWAATRLLVLQQCRAPTRRGSGREVARQMTAFPLLFGEAIVLRAAVVK